MINHFLNFLQFLSWSKAFLDTVSLYILLILTEKVASREISILCPQSKQNRLNIGLKTWHSRQQNVKCYVVWWKSGACGTYFLSPEENSPFFNISKTQLCKLISVECYGLKLGGKLHKVKSGVQRTGNEFVSILYPCKLHDASFLGWDYNHEVNWASCQIWIWSRSTFVLINKK